jgi:hypothetical protein
VYCGNDPSSYCNNIWNYTPGDNMVNNEEILINCIGIDNRYHSRRHDEKIYIKNCISIAICNKSIDRLAE